MGYDGPEKECPRCGWSNFLIRKRCRNCGAALNDAPETEPLDPAAFLQAVYHLAGKRPPVAGEEPTWNVDLFEVERATRAIMAERSPATVGAGFPISLGRTGRGFTIGRFQDRYDQPCSIQDSSLATESCLWLGVDPDMRMHLTQPMAAALIPLLEHFVSHGILPTAVGD